MKTSRVILMWFGIFIVGVLIASAAGAFRDDNNKEGDGSPASSTTKPSGGKPGASTTTKPNPCPSGYEMGKAKCRRVPTTTSSTTTTAPSSTTTPKRDPGPVDLGQACTVSGDRPVYDFDLDGKLAAENFTVAYRGPLETEADLKRFAGAVLVLTCHDPVAMASFARADGIVASNTSDEQLNRLVGFYLAEPELWQKHHNKLATDFRMKGVKFELVSNDDKNATTDAQKDVGDKLPPQLFTETAKGSCDKVVRLTFPSGRKLDVCTGCLQPLRHPAPVIPPSKPATPSTQPCECDRKPPAHTPPVTSPPPTPPTTVAPPQTTAPPSTTAPTTTRPPTTTASSVPPTTKGPQPDPCRLYPSLPGC